jgi:hypothetical protein
MLKKLSKIGVVEGERPLLTKRKTLLNHISLLFMFLVSIKLVGEIIVNDWLGVTIAFLILVLFFIALVFNFYQKSVLAKVYITALIILNITVLNLLFGSGFGAEFGFFPLIMMIIMLYDTTKVKIAWYAIAAICYLTVKIYLNDVYWFF